MLEQDIFSDFIASEILDVDQKLLEEELETIKENFPSTNRSNIGGYQSPLFGSLGIAVPYPYQQFDNLRTSVINFAQDYCSSKLNAMISPTEFCWWLNSNFYGHFNQIHNHKRCDLVGLYYLKAPPKSGELILVRNDGSAYTELFKYNEYHLAPEEGRLYLFPGHLWHLVMPHESDEERVSVSFNLYAS